MSEEKQLPAHPPKMELESIPACDKLEKKLQHLGLNRGKVRLQSYDDVLMVLEEVVGETMAGQLMAGESRALSSLCQTALAAIEKREKSARGGNSDELMGLAALKLVAASLTGGMARQVLSQQLGEGHVIDVTPEKKKAEDIINKLEKKNGTKGDALEFTQVQESGSFGAGAEAQGDDESAGRDSWFG